MAGREKYNFLSEYISESKILARYKCYLGSLSRCPQIELILWGESNIIESEDNSDFKSFRLLQLLPLLSEGPRLSTPPNFYDNGAIMTNFSVLLVADQPVVATLVRLCLYESGIDAIVEVASENKAIEVLKQQKFNLVISNLEIPSMTGVALLNYLKGDSDLRKIPFIMMASQRQLAEVPNLKIDEIAECISKPFTRESVMGAVESVMSRPDEI